jgi:putative transposase
MADSLSMALAELLRKAEAEPDLDTLREGVRVLTQALMELELAQHLGAERYQRSPERQGERNGYRERTWDTRVGTLELRVPRVRDGSFFPSLLEPRKRAERALVATVREAYVQGVSTRRVDDLVKALGLDGISKSQVSVLCQELDTEVERFRTRKLEGSYPYVWVDATFVKTRQDHRVVSMAVVIAVGLNATTGQREVLGVDVGPSEDGAFWLRFLRSLVSRGLTGVQLVTSDAHEGLKGAIAAVLQGASWQRCRTHTIRTQSPDRLTRRVVHRGRTVAERDHVTDLQRMFPDNDALDEQIQQRLFVFEGGLRQMRPDPLTKRGQAGQHLLGSEPLAA